MKSYAFNVCVSGQSVKSRGNPRNVLSCFRLSFKPCSFLQTFPHSWHVLLWSSFEVGCMLSAGCWLRLWEERPAFDLQTFWHTSHTNGELFGFAVGEPLRCCLIFIMFSFLSSSNFVICLLQTPLHSLRLVAVLSQFRKGIFKLDKLDFILSFYRRRGCPSGRVALDNWP